MHTCPLIANFYNYVYYALCYQIAAEITAPLSKTEDIVMLSGNGEGLTGEITKLVGQLPPAVQALTGVDISKVLYPY